MSNEDLFAAETRLELFAGLHPQSGQPIFEQLLASPVDGMEGDYRLLKSPLFVRGVAALDTVRLNKEARGRFEVVARSGLLAVRVFFPNPDPDLEAQLTAEMEKLGGSLDIHSDRAVVYSIHFGIGFSSIEDLLNRWTAGKTAQWAYGNVYDPQSGERLNWWQDLLQV